MQVQMIELEEMSMMDISDEVLERQGGAENKGQFYTSNTACSDNFVYC